MSISVGVFSLLGLYQGFDVDTAISTDVAMHIPTSDGLSLTRVGLAVETRRGSVAVGVVQKVDRLCTS
jgi:hypothetical protein